MNFKKIGKAILVNEFIRSVTYHSNIKWHMTLNTIFSVPFLNMVNDDFSMILP